MAKLQGNSLLEKARSFAKLLAATREFQRFNYAREMLAQDKEASALLRKFMMKQREVEDVRRRGGNVSVAASAEFQKLQREVDENEVLTEWGRGRYEVIGLIQVVSQTISNVAGVDLSQSPPRTGSCK